MEVATKAKLTCPLCGFTDDMEMPTDSCPFFHECVNCKIVLKPNSGDCCVFCSYADVQCPPQQSERAA